MSGYLEDRQFLMKLKNVNDIAFNCALVYCVECGFAKLKTLDIEMMIDENNDFFTPEMQRVAWQMAKEIAENVSSWNLMVFFKEEIPAHGLYRVDIDRCYEIIKNMVGNIDELIPYGESVREYAGMTEDEYEEIVGEEL